MTNFQFTCIIRKIEGKGEEEGYKERKRSVLSGKEKKGNITCNGKVNYREGKGEAFRFGEVGRRGKGT